MPLWLGWVFVYLSIALFIVTVVIGVTIVWAGLFGAPWVPTRKKDHKAIKDFFEFGEKDVFYDLGCGDGRILEEVCPFVGRAIGIEISFLNFLFCYFRFFFNKKVKIKWKSFYKEDLSSSSVIYMFQLPSVNRRLIEKFKRELKPGTRIIAYVFTFPDWVPISVHTAESGSKFYVYKI